MIQKKLVEKSPTVIEYQADFADGLNAIGYLYKSTGQLDETFVSFKKALEIQTKLVKEKPMVTQFQFKLAATHNNLGFFYKLTGQSNKAFKSYQAANKIREKLLKKTPNSILIAIGLGGGYVDTANFARSQDDYNNAAKFYELGMTTLLNVLKNNPQHSKARLFLRNAYSGRARLMYAFERFEESYHDWEQAIKYASGEKKTSYQRYRLEAFDKSKLQKLIKKSKKKSGFNKKNIDKPLIAPRPKRVANKR